MYWATLIAVESLLNPVLDPQVSVFFDKVDKKQWIIKIGETSYNVEGQNKKCLVQDKSLNSYRYVQIKKTSYGTQQIEARTNLKSPWFLAIETRGNIEVIDDLKGIIKIKEENHPIRIHQLSTGKSITFVSSVKSKVIADTYLVLWFPKNVFLTPKIYKLPEMNLIEIKEKDQNKQPPQAVEL